MAKLILMKQTEVSVPEDKKGKQIAVKENNITSLKNFFVNNYKPVVEMPNISEVAPIVQTKIEDITPLQAMEAPAPVEVSPLNTIDPSIITPNIETPEMNIMNSSITEEPIPAVENIPAIETPILSASQPMVLESAIVDPMEPEIPEEIPVETVSNNLEDVFSIPTPIMETPEEEGTNDTESIKLVQDNDMLNNFVIDDEMDPELKEIKNRLDQVISDLNNYKKKIKMLENEVNQNLEKSREVLKDTQAAAKIMSIHQERQNQIMNEMSSNSINDSTRILQKEVA